MSIILAHAQGLVYTLLSLMPSHCQRDSLQALLGLFLQAQGHPLPQQCQVKSASALSRFLNVYAWSTRCLIRESRRMVIQQILSQPRIGRKPILQVIIDLTTLEKRGKFKALDGLVRVYHGKRGLHVVVVYLVVGQWRVPWSFRVYRGKNTASPAQLGLKLVGSLPKALTNHFQVLILVDTAFGSIEFLKGIRKFKYHAIAGVRCDRQLQDGRSLKQLHKRGSQVRLVGLKFPVTISWYYLKRDGGKLEKRFVLSTKALKGSTITWWGKRRWQIEGWFKIAKHRFGLHRFGQATLKGIYRWLVLSLIAYLLAHWAYLSTASPNLPDWAEAAKLALEVLLPQLVILPLLLEFQRLQPLLRTQGLELQITRCKM
ncbi:MAG: IS701 family transposase ISAcma37 [Chroococcidiopsis cubana SAG 39.79]|uniref:transposase n=1 Tax=Chroococcidiopsis cubana TaxID=171392 RepID=UPI000D069EF4|nr:transposase [Chroococcidiopsis cubana]MDZ4876633.1 IS701 family transposase ISAcma37 [Chroococcidiopsis cubana SAG 39.79]PSB50951.1 IS701 family transposase [Chroococcidiopsis cubana CCALA 043]